MRKIYLISVIVLVLGGIWLNGNSTVPPPLPTPPLLPLFTSYRHFTKSFSVQVPQGWYVNANDDGFVTSEPLGGALLEAQVVNTGVALTDASFARYVETLEETTFATFANYKILEHAATADCVLWRKTLQSKNVAYEVRSRYCHQAEAAWQISLWAPLARLQDYDSIWQTVITSWQIDLPTLKTFTPYRDHYVATEANRRADYWVPYGWRRVGEVFTAPDELNVVRLDVLALSDDELAFERTLYSEVTLVSERTVKETRYLTWITPTVRGQTMVTVKGAQKFSYTWSVKNSAAEVFAPTGERLLALFNLR